MPISPEILQYGIAGVLAIVASKSIDLAAAMYKTSQEKKLEKIEAEKPPPPPDPRIARSLATEATILRIERVVSRIERVVISGNGKPGLVTSVAVMSEQLAAHVSNEHIHKK